MMMIGGARSYAMAANESAELFGLVKHDAAAGAITRASDTRQWPTMHTTMHATRPHARRLSRLSAGGDLSVLGSRFSGGGASGPIPAAGPGLPG